MSLSFNIHMVSHTFSVCRSLSSQTGLLAFKVTIPSVMNLINARDQSFSSLTIIIFLPLNHYFLNNVAQQYLSSCNYVSSILYIYLLHTYVYVSQDVLGVVYNLVSYLFSPSGIPARLGNIIQRERRCKTLL